MIEVFLAGLPSLKVELQIDIATVLGWCALFSILLLWLQLQEPFCIHLPLLSYYQ